MHYIYTLEQALLDIEATPTKEEIKAKRVSVDCLADGFALLERFDVRVQAVLMGEENLSLLKKRTSMLDTKNLAVGSLARLWSADIFCPIMPSDIVYCLSRNEETPEEPPRCLQINLGES